MPEAAVRELSDQVWERILARDPAAALRCGRQVDALPRGGPGELAENVSFAGAMLPKLAGTGGVQAAFLRDHLEHELARSSGSGWISVVPSKTHGIFMV